MSSTRRTSSSVAGRDVHGLLLVAFGNLHDNARDAAFGQDSVVLVYDEVAARVVFELRAPRSHWLAGDFTFEAVGSVAGEARHRV